MKMDVILLGLRKNTQLLQHTSYCTESLKYYQHTKFESYYLPESFKLSSFSINNYSELLVFRYQLTPELG